MSDKPPTPVPPYDQRIANEAAAIDQCMKLGAILLPQQKKPGFSSRDR